MTSDIRRVQDRERERIERACPGHDWESSPLLGVVVGLSACRRCGTVSRRDHFPAVSR